MILVINPTAEELKILAALSKYARERNRDKGGLVAQNLLDNLVRLDRILSERKPIEIPK